LPSFKANLCWLGFWIVVMSFGLLGDR